MELKLKRKYRNPKYTIGAFSIDSVFFTDSLEDPDRDLNKNGKFDGNEKKVMHETAIPYGTYDVIVNYSPKFKRRLPRLLNVPHFEGILIHRGNSAKDTSGCILIGENKVVGGLINSTKWELELIKRIDAAVKRGEKVTITIE